MIVLLVDLGTDDAGSGIIRTKVYRSGSPICLKAMHNGHAIV
jgi:hypothetical protein